MILRSIFYLLVSIHAPVWGATREISMGYTAELVSIHAPVWGATHVNHDNLEP